MSKVTLRSEMTIRGRRLANRLVMPPMATAKASPEGLVTDAVLDYYREKTRGGYLGLVITEHSYVSREGMAGSRQMAIDREETVPGLKTLAETIRSNGSLAVCQISHAGGAAQESFSGLVPIAPSAVEYGKGRNAHLPKEMSPDDIRRVRECFLAAACRAAEAGFDGVELHAAHGYLLNQFWSPLTNRRTDAYGGPAENRLRLLCEIVRGIKERLGDRLLVLVRFGACDYLEGGNTLSDALTGAKLLQEAGADLLDISGGLAGFERKDNPLPGFFTDTSKAIKAKAQVPVIVTGGVTDRATADKLLELDCADLIGVGKAILRDSDWAKNAMEAIV